MANENTYFLIQWVVWLLRYCNKTFSSLLQWSIRFKKLKVSVKKFLQLSSCVYYTLDCESLSDCVIFIYHSCSILKFKNLVLVILYVFIFNVYIKLKMCKMIKTNLMYYAEVIYWIYFIHLNIVQLVLLLFYLQSRVINCWFCIIDIIVLFCFLFVCLFFFSLKVQLGNQ